MNLNDLQSTNRSVGKIVIKLKTYQLIMLGLGMSEKDAKTITKLLHIGRRTNRVKTKSKQYIRICKIMYKYGYVLSNSL